MLSSQLPKIAFYLQLVEYTLRTCRQGRSSFVFWRFCFITLTVTFRAPLKRAFTPNFLSEHTHGLMSVDKKGCAFTLPHWIYAAPIFHNKNVNGIGWKENRLAWVRKFLLHIKIHHECIKLTLKNQNNIIWNIDTGYQSSFF